MYTYPLLTPYAISQYSLLTYLVAWHPDRPELRPTLVIHRRHILHNPRTRDHQGRLRTIRAVQIHIQDPASKFVAIIVTIPEHIVGV